MVDKLTQLKQMTTVVCDTGDINSIKQYTPTDATTNPSLIFQAASDPRYHPLIEEAIQWGKKKTSDSAQQLSHILDKVMVNFGVEILKTIPGRVSTEVDARLSFDTQGSITKALAIIELYEQAGIDPSRILIKLASTWEGIQAARVLEREGIHCNMTLMFSLIQAVKAADIGATLISPFVGRILDWYKAHDKVDTYPPEQDPGVLSVKAIYNYYKKFGYPTQVMGASFRNVEEILQLAGCDLLTIAPKFLDSLQKDQGTVTRQLTPDPSKTLPMERIVVDEPSFRHGLNANAMANDKLSEGIRLFTVDTVKLEKLILQKL